MYGPLLVPVILEKIPEMLTLIVNRQFSNNDNWDIKLVVDLLKTELGAREQALTNSLDKSDRFITTEIFHTSANNRESNGIHSSNSLNRIPHRYNSFPNNIGQASYFERNNPKDLQKLNKRLFCDQPHKSQYCRSVTSIQSRKNIISDKKTLLQMFRKWTHK